MLLILSIHTFENTPLTQLFSAAYYTPKDAATFNICGYSAYNRTLLTCQLHLLAACHPNQRQVQRGGGQDRQPPDAPMQYPEHPGSPSPSTPGNGGKHDKGSRWTAGTPRGPGCASGSILPRRQGCPGVDPRPAPGSLHPQGQPQEHPQRPSLNPLQRPPDPECRDRPCIGPGRARARFGGRSTAPRSS